MPYAQSLQGQCVPDGVLVGQAQAGDQNAFELLVSRYHYPLVSYIQSFLKDTEHSYDVLQHVYLKLHVSLSTLLTHGSLKPWLFQVAHNLCLDELRRKRRWCEIPFSRIEQEDNEEGVSSLEAIPNPGPLPEEIAEGSDLRYSLQQAIVTLPPKFRLIVYLHCFKELSFSETARRLNMPEPTVKTYFYRSLPRLRRSLMSSTRFAVVS